MIPGMQTPIVPVVYQKNISSQYTAKYIEILDKLSELLKTTTKISKNGEQLNAFSTLTKKLSFRTKLCLHCVTHFLILS